MAIENSVSNDFSSTFVDSINVFDCRLGSVIYKCNVHILTCLTPVATFVICYSLDTDQADKMSSLIRIQTI